MNKSATIASLPRRPAAMVVGESANSILQQVGMTKESVKKAVVNFSKREKSPVAEPPEIKKDKLLTQTNTEPLFIIQKIVSDYCHLNIEDMSSKRRPREIAFPRQVAMFLCHVYTNNPLKVIGKAFGKRDHGTVIYACKVVKERLSNPELEKQIAALRAAVEDALAPEILATLTPTPVNQTKGAIA